MGCPPRSLLKTLNADGGSIANVPSREEGSVVFAQVPMLTPVVMKAIFAALRRDLGVP